MDAHLALPAAMRDEWLAAGVRDAAPGAPTVAGTGPVGDTWPTVLDRLTAVFEAAQAAARTPSPIVFVVSADSILGRRGPLEAMAANGIAAAARSLAAEMRKAGVPVNTIALADDTPTGAAVDWARTLLAGGRAGPTGEVVTLGGVQVGKALS